MGRLHFFALGAGLAIVGCAASATFPYRYYTLHPDSYSGKLEGAKPQDDLNLQVCAPEQGKQNKCIVMLKDPYLQLKADYLNLATQLEACQRGQR